LAGNYQFDKKRLLNRTKISGEKFLHKKIARQGLRFFGPGLFIRPGPLAKIKDYPNSNE
jgi:hypothetical protein